MADTVLRRKAYEKLLEWKIASMGSRGAYVRGCPRVGKTYMVGRFLGNNYETAAVLDLRADPGAKEVLSDASDPAALVDRIGEAAGVELRPRKSAVFIDNADLLPDAKSVVGAVVADGRADCIAAGSLPLAGEGPVDEVPMRPMDFEEYLWAVGEDKTADLIRERYRMVTPMGEDHARTVEMYRQHLLFGGMPGPVAEFVESQSVDGALAAARKAAEEIDARIANEGPANAGKAYRDARSSLWEETGDLRKSPIWKDSSDEGCAEALQWLQDARLLFSSAPATGLPELKSEGTRYYVAATGQQACLGQRKLGFGRRKESLPSRIGKDDVALLRNEVACDLLAAGYELRHWGGIDFVLVKKGRAYPVIVGRDLSQYALKALVDFTGAVGKEYGQPYVFWDADLGVLNGIAYLPAYMAPFI